MPTYTVSWKINAVDAADAEAAAKECLHIIMYSDARVFNVVDEATKQSEEVDLEFSDSDDFEGANLW